MRNWWFSSIKIVNWCCLKLNRFSLNIFLINYYYWQLKWIFKTNVIFCSIFRWIEILIKIWFRLTINICNIIKVPLQSVNEYHIVLITISANISRPTICEYHSIHETKINLSTESNSFLVDFFFLPFHFELNDWLEFRVLKHIFSMMHTYSTYGVCMSSNHKTDFECKWFHSKSNRR